MNSITIELPTLPKFERLSAYATPNIPTNKLMNAIKSHGSPSLQTEDVLLIVDLTVFGSAKDSLLLTKGGSISLKELFFSPRIAMCYQVTSVSYNKARIVINFNNNDSWEFAILGSETDARIFSQYFNEIVARFRQSLEKFNEQVKKSLAAKEADKKTSHAEDSNASPIKKTKKVTSVSKTSRYFGTRIDNDGTPEPPYFGENTHFTSEQRTDSNSEANSVLRIFLQNNSDGIISKLKASGLSLTASALQNDANIAKIANFIYNLLPSPIRFVVNVSIIEDFLLKNRFWLIEKLK